MYPSLFAFGGFSQPTYGAVLLVAVFAGAALALDGAARRGLDEWRMLEPLLLGAFVGLLGARLGFAVWVGAGDGAMAPPAAGFAQLGVGLGVLGAALYLRAQHWPVLASLDAMAPGIPLALGLGRLGCLAAGCCYGTATGLPWAIVYREPAAHILTGVPLHVGLHPAPLYHAALALLTFIVVRSLARREGLPAGTALTAFLAMDGVARLIVEPFRGDPRGLMGALTPASVLAALYLAVALGLAAGARLRPGAEAMS